MRVSIATCQDRVCPRFDRAVILIVIDVRGDREESREVLDISAWPAVPMLVIEVPFGKWAHLAYRPLVIYLMKVKERARELEVSPAAAASPV